MRVAESCYSENWCEQHSWREGVPTPFFITSYFGEIMESGRLRLGKDVIPPFSGEGDVVGWIKKVKLVAKLQKVQDLVSFIPLFLHGDVLALYLEMSNEDQVRAEQIEMRLVTAFTEGPFEAYEKLKRFKWTGESVDVYANTIKRLAELAGYVEIGLDHTAKLAFIIGFPDDVSVALQQLSHIERMDVSKLLPAAWLLVSKRMQKTETVGASAQSNALRNKAQKGLSSLQCFRCRGPHYIKYCMEIPRAKVISYNCGKFGLMARYCTQIQGNRQWGASAPVATPATD